MPRVLLAILLLAGVAPVAWPCWAAIDPRAFAADCPIIVAGTIEAVAEAAPGGERADDVASIRVQAVLRNALIDVGLQPGDLFRVRMISKNNRQRTSTDLNYAANTQATWLVVLTGKGEFRIDKHPVQKQPFDVKLKLGDVQVVNKSRNADNTANPAGSMSTAQWIARMNHREAERAKAMAAHQAQQKATRDLAKAFADAEELDEAIWKRYQESEVDVRRGILQLSIREQPMTGPRFAELAQGVLAHEKDDNVRTHAVSQLAYCRDPGAKGMAVLAAALRDSSASVRLFACQSVKMRRYEKLTTQVNNLQNDPDGQVRDMATHALEFWRVGAK